MGFGKDGKGVIFEMKDVITLLALGTSAVVKEDNVPAFTDSFRVLKTKGVASIEGATLVDGDGPVLLYLVNDQLTTGEITEKINAGGPLSREDTTKADEAMRPVFYLGKMDFRPPTATQEAPTLEWERSIRWTFGDAKGFAVVAFNMGSGSLTTGGIVRFQHTLYGVWVGA